MLMTAILALFGAQEDATARKAVAEYRRILGARETTESERIEAIRKLGAVRHPSVVRALVPLLTAGPENLRMETAQALSAFGQVRGTAVMVAPALVSADNARRTRVRIAILRSLVALKQVEAVPYFHKMIRDDDFLVAREAIVGLPSFGRKESVPELIAYVRICERVVSGSVLRVPSKVAGDLSSSPEWNFSVQMDADQKQKLRREVLLRPLLDSLQALTGKTYTTWKEWNAWSGSSWLR